MSEQNKNDLPQNYVPQDQVIPRTPLDSDLTPAEEEILKRKLAELRKRDPFIYR